MVNVRGADPPPPGAGVKTVTVAVPGAAMSAAPMEACSCVALKNVVGRFAPFQRTMEPAMNRLPFTVSVNDAPPRTTALGVSDVATGI